VPSSLQKITQLARLFPQHPGEAWDRLRTVVEVRRDRLNIKPPRYQSIPSRQALPLLQQAMGTDLQSIWSEDALEDIERHVLSRTEDLAGHAPFGLFHNGDCAFARFCYLVCRTLRPQATLETGVAYGVTSSFVLKALHQNETGELLSVDLPPLGSRADSFVGFFIPQAFRCRWHLHRGQSRNVMPALLEKLGTLDLFIHDSLQTHQNMAWEFRQAWPRIRGGGVLIADDVDQNRAFEDFVNEFNPKFSVVVQEETKSGAFGVAVKAI